MPIRGHMSTDNTILQFFRGRDGEYTVDQIARTVFLSTATINQYARFMVAKGILERRKSPEGHHPYLYRLATKGMASDQGQD